MMEKEGMPFEVPGRDQQQRDLTQRSHDPIVLQHHPIYRALWRSVMPAHFFSVKYTVTSSKVPEMTSYCSFRPQSLIMVKTFNERPGKDTYNICIQGWVLHVPEGFCVKSGKCRGGRCRIKGSQPELSTLSQLESHTSSLWASKYVISTQTLKLLYRSWAWVWTWKYICGKSGCGCHLSSRPHPTLCIWVTHITVISQSCHSFQICHRCPTLILPQCRSEVREA